ncbi:HNH endonuclease signature motif containing protein [Streptomyces sp. NPDC056367]|uniref:HNH endonuclease signature motif containing protein n=1 Tax=Streptomyces sp. NPDC056367 TaxID=3345797 RepID=UPI0035E26FFF
MSRRDGSAAVRRRAGEQLYSHSGITASGGRRDDRGPLPRPEPVRAAVPSPTAWARRRVTRDRIRLLQQRSRHGAEDDADNTAHRLRARANRRNTPYPLPKNREWLTARQLEGMLWTPAATEALIPERLSHQDAILYNVAQLRAVLREFHAWVANDDESAHFRTRDVRERIQLLQRRSRERAEADAERARRQLLRRGMLQETPELDAHEIHDTAPPSLPEPATDPGYVQQPRDDRPATPDRLAPQPKKAPPVHGAYPPDLGPDPRTLTAAATPKPAALPDPTPPLDGDELAREYRRLNDMAKLRQEDTRGRRRAGSSRPVRILPARRAVIHRSKGRCENPQCAGHPVDVTDAGEPLLEVDHIDELATGIDDDAQQMIALCANCHDLKTRGRSRHELIPVLRAEALRLHAELYHRNTR